MKVSNPFSALLAVLFFSLVIAGCKKDDDNPVAAQPGLDPNIVGVWYSASDSTGVEIKNDGTFLNLMIGSSGTLIYEPTPAGSPTFKITTSSPNNFTLHVTGPSVMTGRDTTVTVPGTYVLSNNNNSLIITTIDEGTPTVQVYARSSIGAHVVSAPAGLRSKQPL